VRVLVLSSVFPNTLRPSFGIFVRERSRRIATHCAVEVVAPVAWFPFNRLIRGRARSDVPYQEVDGELPVHHPRVFSLPAIGKSLDGLFYFFSVFFFVRRLRRRFPFDVIDVHFAYPDGIAAVLLGKAFSCPVVLTMRGNEIEAERFVLRRWQMGLAARRARVVVVGAGLRDLAARLGAPQARVIPNGVDVSVFRPSDRRTARRALGLPQACRILVSVAAFVPRKGHEQILDLLPGLRRAIPALLYVAVGNPGGGESRLRCIEERVRREGLGDCVRLAVARPHGEIALWLAAADAFCLATEREGSSNAILEALACGLPVVTTDIPANREVIREGENGFLVPYFDAAAFSAAILRALEGDWDRRAIARSVGRTWEDVAGEAVEELRAAVAASPSGA